jgi:predicted PurR-regulated permease PerM
VVFVTAAVAALFYNFDKVIGVFGEIFSVLRPIFYSIIITVLIFPLYRFFKEKALAGLSKKKKREKLIHALAIVCSFAIAIIIILAVILLLVVPTVNSINELINSEERQAPGTDDELDLSDYVTRAKSWVERNLNTDSPFLKTLYTDVIESVLDTIDLSYEGITQMFPAVAGTLGKIATEASNIVLGIIISIYTIASKEQLKRIAAKLALAFMKHETALRIKAAGSKVYYIFAEYLSRRLIYALITGAVFYVILMIMGIPFYYLIAIIIALITMIPVIAAPAAGIFSIFMVFVLSPAHGVWYISIFIAAVVLARIFVYPRIIKDSSNAGIGASLVSIVIMYALFGVFGALFAVPTYLSVKHFVLKAMREKNV